MSGASERSKQPAARPAAQPRTLLLQRVDDVDPARANRQVLRDLAAGAGGLALVFEGAPNAFGYGLPATAQALSAALEGVNLSRAHLRIDVHPASRATAEWLVGLIGRQRIDPARLSLGLGIDPAALFAGTGRLRMSIEALQASLPQSLAHLLSAGVPGVLLEADGRVFHNAGASPAQEIGAMLAGAVAHLSLFEEARQPLVYAAPHIGFAMSVDDDGAVTAAKVAALGELWRKLQQARSIPPTGATIHAETSFRMMTDSPEENAALAAAAAAGALAAGVDTLSVLPASLPFGLPGPGARTAALVSARPAGDAPQPSQHQSPAGAVADELAGAAWKEFRQIQAEGGILRSLLAGSLQQRVLEARREAPRPAWRTGTGGDRTPAAHGQAAGDGGDLLPAEPRLLPSDGAVFCRPLHPWRAGEDPEAEGGSSP